MVNSRQDPWEVLKASYIQAVGTVAPGIRPFPCRTVLGVKSCKTFEVGAKFGELGTLAYIPYQLAVYCSPPDTKVSLVGAAGSFPSSAIVARVGQSRVLYTWGSSLSWCIRCHVMPRQWNAEAPDRCREQRRGEADPPIPCWVAAFSVVGPGGVAPAQKRQRQRCPAQRDGGDARGVALDRDAAATVREARSSCGTAGWVWKAAPAEGKMRNREVWCQHRNGNGNTTPLAAMAEMRENSWGATSGKRVALSSGQAVAGSPDGGLAGSRIALTRANGIQQVQASGTIKRVFWAYFKSLDVLYMHLIFCNFFVIFGGYFAFAVVDDVKAI
ncbi:hypothetical protein B0H14DRAFT_3151406 [Mycena olivaceomarginata]|nr:hypothetical protein B0H14DRAFT_3151406 [Mycena olivaceomarginata]